MGELIIVATLLVYYIAITIFNYQIGFGDDELVLITSISIVNTIIILFLLHTHFNYVFLNSIKSSQLTLTFVIFLLLIFFQITIYILSGPYNFGHGDVGLIFSFTTNLIPNILLLMYGSYRIYKLF